VFITPVGVGRYLRRHQTNSHFQAEPTEETSNREEKSQGRSLGSSGAASPVRKIDPATGAVMEILNLPKLGST
jgi:hypothetical protein